MRFLRALIPSRLKRGAKNLYFDLKLRRAIRRIASLPVGEIPTEAMLVELQAAWGNQGFAARTDFLLEVARQAATTIYPILECGSGASTLLLGLIAGRRGVKTYSLEHIEQWRARVVRCLTRSGIPNVEILLTPLREFEEFAWYDAPLNRLPDRFGLVICDGPPGETRGGRYGLLPRMRERLGPGTVILLDDTERSGEAEVLRRWKSEANLSVSVQDSPQGSFAIVTCNDDSRKHRIASSQSPQVSVVIPAYNSASHIAETLQSVFAQTFTNHEVLVINDGSRDARELEQAIAPFRDRITYLKQENQGVSVARNAGVQGARGELIAFLDADDIWLPNYLEEQLTFLRGHDCDLVCADAMLFDGAGDQGRTYMEWVMKDAPPVSRVTFRDLVSAERSLITSGVVVRRDLVLDVGLFDADLRTAQDFDLWLRLACHGASLMYHRTALLRYRCHQAGLTGGATNSLTRELRILEKVETSYRLTADERAEILPIIRRRKAVLEFELGKLLMAEGEIASARSAFAKACAAAPTVKRQVVLWLSRLTPFLIQPICMRRARAADAR